jgi:hypothetical protein
MIEGIRLVRDLVSGAVHRADCPCVLSIPPGELAPFDGLERTLSGEEWPGTAGRSKRCMRWCTCTKAAVLRAIAQCLDQSEPSLNAQLVGWMRDLAFAYERRLEQFADRLCESPASHDSIDAEKPTH